MKHKHCDLIKAWADGAKIEYYNQTLSAWMRAAAPLWCEETQYRIKKDKVKKWKFAVQGASGDWFVTGEHYTEEYVKQYLSGNYIKIPQTEIEVEV